MATNTEVASKGAGSAESARERRANSAEAPIRPSVDIREDDEGITLCADMPGVSRDRLELRVEANTLILEGSAHLDLPGNAEALYADVRSSTYRRTFALSSELETDKIEANLKDGVLTVRIPKRRERRPRRIEVRAT